MRLAATQPKVRPLSRRTSKADNRLKVSAGLWACLGRGCPALVRESHALQALASEGSTERPVASRTTPRWLRKPRTLGGDHALHRYVARGEATGCPRFVTTWLLGRVCRRWRKPIVGVRSQRYFETTDLVLAGCGGRRARRGNDHRSYLGGHKQCRRFDCRRDEHHRCHRNHFPLDRSCRRDSASAEEVLGDELREVHSDLREVLTNEGPASRALRRMRCGRATRRRERGRCEQRSCRS